VVLGCRGVLLRLQLHRAAAPDYLAEQIRDLQAKLAKLETALKQKQIIGVTP
jgi:hypothetical protein